jgi:signal transduction histidine kinase
VGDDPGVSLQPYEENYYVWADTRLLKRTLDNSLGNALRFADTQIYLQLENCGDHCRIHVCDEGTGVPEVQRETVLQAFSHVDTGVGKIAGFGLGLAIVRRVMDLIDVVPGHKTLDP